MREALGLVVVNVQLMNFGFKAFESPLFLNE
jgi:hypothetical protein